MYDWEEMESNKKEFQEVIEELGEERESSVVWICKFCERKNVLR